MKAVESCGSYGGVAQLGEHLPCKQGVDSSILFISTSGLKPRKKERAGGKANGFDSDREMGS